MKGNESNKRQSVNAVSLFVTCVFLFLAVQFSDGGGEFAIKINKITKNLDQALQGLDNNVTYTNYTDNSTYRSSVEFKAGGMAGLYNLTNSFIDAFVPEDILMKGIFYFNNNNQLSVNDYEVSEVFKYYANLVAVTMFLLLCVLLFPLCGIIFCCCRCCGNCGAKPRPSDKKKDTCKKVVYATLLILCFTGLLFCIVCAFGSNQQLQDGIDNLPPNMDTGIQDVKAFMDSTLGQISHLLVENYDQFSTAFFDLMGNASAIAMEQLMEYTKASAVSEIANFADKLEGIGDQLHSLKDNTNKLRVYASQLNDAIRKVKRDLTNTLQGCDVPGCDDVRSKVARLQTSIDFNLVPDVSDTINSFNNLSVDEIQQAANSAQDGLKNISTNIEKRLDDGLSKAKLQINNTKQIIQEQLNSITGSIKDIKSQIDDSATTIVNKAQTYISDYGPYRYYVGLAISCILLLVTVCITFGLICGICGKRPDGYSDNCCNKGAGAQFLICAVMIMFLFGFILSVITTVSLIAGVLSEKAICDPFRNPDPDKYTIIQLIDNFNLNFGVNVKPSALLNNCYQNKSIYETFNLESTFNLNDVETRFNISEQLSNLTIDDAIPANFVLLSDAQMLVLEQLTSFKPNVDVDKFAYELQNNLTNYNLNELATGLQVIISEVGPGPLTNELELSLLHLNTYDNKLIKPMKQLASDLVTTADQLNYDLKMNKSSFEVAIKDLIEEINEAQVALNTTGRQQLANTTRDFKEVVINLTVSYIDRVSNYIQYEIGQCGPLNLVIHATITATCNKTLLPWNGFWFSFFWTIILYVITIVISVKLASLYQKHKPYDQYVETRGAKRGKKKGKKSKRYEERPVAREVARDYAAGSHPPDGRYADMAPKHWEDFPNGGPPHYQRAPTEYERPPPYYYPGSAGEQ